MLLAGAFRSDNSRAALETVRLKIVDVSSGVKHRPIKDPHQ